jgi:hypothetical protein
MTDDLSIEATLQIGTLIGAAPWILVMLAGGIVCLRRLSIYPREARLVGSAIVVAFGAVFAIPNLMNLMFRYLPGTVSFSENNYWPYVITSLPANIANATAFGLILYAAFGSDTVPRTKYLKEGSETSSP